MALYIAILIFGEVSGGHFNPATTLGVLIREGKVSNLPLASYIILSQVFGAFLGNVFQYLTIFMKYYESEDESGKKTYQFDPFKDGINILCSFDDDNTNSQAAGGEFLDICDPGDNNIRVLWVEMVCTFIAVSFILSLKYHSSIQNSVLSSISIGMTFFVMLSISVGLTGGCLNPAIGVSSTVFQNLIKG